MRKSLIIMTLCVISPLLLTSCWWNKDTQPTVDTVDTPIGETSPYTLNELEALFSGASDTKLDVAYTEVDTMDITNYLAGGQKNIKSLIASLTGTDTATVEKRAYLMSYMGNYSGALAEREILCKDDPDACNKKLITLVVENLVDTAGNPVIAPNIYLNSEKINTEGAITQTEVYDDMVHRLRIEKEGYLDTFSKVNGVEGVSVDFTINPTMVKAPASITIDNQVGGTYSVGTGVRMISYTIAPDTFTDASGRTISGTVSVYLFNLGYANQDLSVFGLDTFTPDGTSVGGSMVTDGMPFVTAYRDGGELVISKPIEGIGTMELGQTFSVDLEGVPKSTWLGYDELQKYGLPGYWKLDRKSGVWIESQMQVLDTTGRYKFNFQ